MENLGVDPKLLIAQLINFGLFFFVFSKFIAQPFLGYIAGEKKKDAERQKAAELALRQEELLKKQRDEAHEKIKKETETAMKRIREDVESVRKDLLAQAQKESQDLIEKAHKQIADERRTAEKDMKERISDLSVLVVTRVLNEYLDENAQKGITKRILSNLPDVMN